MKTGHVFRTAVTGRVDTDALRVANDRPLPPRKSTPAPAVGSVPAPTNEAFADAIRKQQEHFSKKG